MAASDLEREKSVCIKPHRVKDILTQKCELSASAAV